VGLVGEQGLLGLVDEEDGMFLMVEDAEGLVRVVCPNAQLEISNSAAVTTMNARIFIRSNEFRWLVLLALEGAKGIAAREKAFPTLDWPQLPILKTRDSSCVAFKWSSHQLSS
jgi:hypothetical protein